MVLRNKDSRQLCTSSTMLSPIKAFLTTLQKNAGASIFGLTEPDDQDDASTSTTAAAAETTTTNETKPSTETTTETEPETTTSLNEITSGTTTAENCSQNPTTTTSNHVDCASRPAGTAVEFQLMTDEPLPEDARQDPFCDPLALGDDEHLQHDDESATNAASMDPPERHDMHINDTEVPLTLRDEKFINDVFATSIAASLTDDIAKTATVDDLHLDTEMHFEVVDSVASEPQPTKEMVAAAEEGGTRSDGSDSGLGLESAATTLTNISSSCNTSLAEISAIEEVTAVAATPPPAPRQPLRTALKRRSDSAILSDVDGLDASYTSANAKRAKRHIHFNDVTVFYFQRQQGFMCVPSQGGCSLGMAPQHMYHRRFTLPEHTAEQRRVQRHKAQELKRSAGLPVSSSEDSAGASDDEGGGSGDPSAFDSPAHATPSGGSATAICTPLDAPATYSDSDDPDTLGIQPVNVRQRRLMLKAAGVRKIDASEKKECRDILMSRENCGCDCRGFCYPETCACAQSGIKCQVDRLHYPCGCTRDGCGNQVGRAEFNKARVKTHYIHTFLRLQLETAATKPPPPQPMVPIIPPQMPAIDVHNNNASASSLSTAVAGGASPSIWHSQIGRSLAAMSGDNLYNMNGAATTQPQTAAATTTSSAMATSMDHCGEMLPTMATASGDLLHLDALQPDLHFAYNGGGDELVSSPFDCFGVAATASASANLSTSPTHGSVLMATCGSPSGLNSGLSTPTPTGMSAAHASVMTTSLPAFVALSAAAASASMYSPDSASIVEPTATTALLHTDYSTHHHPPSADCYLPAAAVDASIEAVHVAMAAEVTVPVASVEDETPATPSAIYPEFHHSTSGITSYQHSYLFSIINGRRDEADAEASVSSLSSIDNGAPSDERTNSSFQHSYELTVRHPLHQSTSSSALEQSISASAASASLAADEFKDDDDDDDTTSNGGLHTTLDELLSESNSTPEEPTPTTTTTGADAVGLDCFEPIDFESELAGLSTTIIDKSRKTFVRTTSTDLVSAVQTGVVAAVGADSNGYQTNARDPSAESD